MAVCVDILPDGSIHLLNPQPATSTECLYWVGQGAEIGALEIPPAATFAEAFGWGFGLVLVSYMAGWAVGCVVNFFNKD